MTLRSQNIRSQKIKDKDPTNKDPNSLKTTVKIVAIIQSL